MGKHYRRLPALVDVCVIAVVLGFNSRPASAQIMVNSSTPNNAPQGTIALNVTVAGKGFERGANAAWLVSGTTETGGVTVNSTTFVSSSQLVANVTIADNATVSGYDIKVTNKSGRTGVGSDLFTVNPEAVTSSLYDTDATGNTVTVRGDGLVSNFPGASTYDNTPESCSGTRCTILSVLPNDWYLRLENQTYRAVRLTFIAIDGSPGKSALDGTYPASIATRCFDANYNRLSIPLVIPPNTSNNHCSLRVNFVANGTSYLYIMSPDPTNNPAPSGWSTVACTGAIGSKCNAWSIMPTPGNLLPNSSLANVANLYTVAKSGKMTLVGKYLMTFNIALTQP